MIHVALRQQTFDLLALLHKIRDGASGLRILHSVILTLVHLLINVALRNGLRQQTGLFQYLFHK